MKRLFPLLITLVLAALPVQAQTSTAEIATEIVQVGALHEATVTQNGGSRLVPLSATLTQEGTNHTATQTQTHGGVWSAGGMQATIEQVGGTGHVAVQQQGGDWLRGGLTQGDLSAYIRQAGGADSRATQYQAWTHNEARIEQIGGAGNVAAQVQSRSLPIDLLSPRLASLSRLASLAVSTAVNLFLPEGGYLKEGGDHLATITQTGTEDSRAWQWQRGTGNEASITQRGGAGNLALQVQFGRGNVSTITQTGSHHQAFVLQGGSGNIANITQSN